LGMTMGREEEEVEEEGGGEREVSLSVSPL
jgi:hypothetical protein